MNLILKSKIHRYLAILTAVALLATTILCAPTPVQAEDSQTTITNPTVNYMTDPLGVDKTDVRFGWQMESKVIGQAQKSYQIKVTKTTTDGAVVWDSGKVNSAVSVGIPYNGSSLAVETRYYWTVAVTDITGETTVSNPAYFETGTSFKGVKWIVPPNQDYNHAVMLRMQKQLTKKAASAKLYISGLGVYTAYINGEEVLTADGSDDIFNPGWTDYNAYVNYQTYDVSDYIPTDTTTEKVALGVALGKGWYGGRIGTTGNYKSVIGASDTATELALLAKLVITYVDGTKVTYTTNATDWKSSVDSPITRNDFYDGETYDANAEAAIAGWNDVDFSDGAWDTVLADTYTGEVRPGAEFQATVNEDLTRTPVSAYTYDPAAVVTSPTSIYARGHVVTTPEATPAGSISLPVGKTLILDMGQNMVGVPKISVEGAQNTEVTIRFGEMLNDGTSSGDGPKDTLYVANLNNAKFDKYILSSAGGPQTYQPAFTYHGYRYLEIKADNPIILSNVAGKVITSASEETGIITTDNADINQLVSNTKWSQRGNYFTLPTDCPQRDERAGWTGDAQLFAETALYNFDVTAFLENYVEIMNAHMDEKGRYEAIMPAAYSYGNVVGSGWSDAGIIIPYDLYQQTGDSTMIRVYFSHMDKYMDDVIAAGGYPTSKFGDWLCVEGASIRYMNDVYQIYTTKLMAEMAEVIGNQSAIAKYENRLAELTENFQNDRVDADGNVLSSVGGTSSNVPAVADNAQTALLWALKLELYKNEAQRGKWIDLLVANIKNDPATSISAVRANYPENTLAVGFLGVNVLLPVLTEEGGSKTAYDLLLQEESPSWLYAVKNGATTIWERWNSYSLEAGFVGGMNSFNHYSYGACLEWMYEYMLGIQKDSGTGFRTMILQPTVDASGRITEASGSYDSYYGKISSGWEAVSGKLSAYAVTIPANTSATLYLEVTQTAAEAMEDIIGVTYKGMTKHNGKSVAEFALLSGSYLFDVVGNRLTVALATGYSGEELESILVDDAKADLSDLIAEYAQAEESDYSPATWTAFSSALAHARSVLAQATPDLAEIKAATDALERAKAALVIKTPETEKVKATVTNAIVTYDSNGGTSLAFLNKIVTVGSAYGAFPKVTKKGNTLKGWYTQKTAGVKVATTTKVTNKANHSLFAQWKAASYKVKFNVNKGKKIKTKSKSVTYAKKFGKLPTPKRSGYTFKGWYTKKVGGKKVTKNSTVKITKATTLYAHWKKK